MTLYCVSSFGLDSDGRSEVSLEIYSDLESAQHAYNSGKKGLKHDSCYEDKDGDYYSQRIEEDVAKTDINEQGFGFSKFKSLSSFEDGSWKHPRGVELLVVEKKDNETRETSETNETRPGLLYSFPIRAYPNHKTYGR